MANRALERSRTRVDELSAKLERVTHVAYSASRRVLLLWESTLGTRRGLQVSQQSLESSARESEARKLAAQAEMARREHQVTIAQVRFSR